MVVWLDVRLFFFKSVEIYCKNIKIGGLSFPLGVRGQPFFSPEENLIITNNN